jgi:hypothetical protein
MSRLANFMIVIIHRRVCGLFGLGISTRTYNYFSHHLHSLFVEEVDYEETKLELWLKSSIMTVCFTS